MKATTNRSHSRKLSLLATSSQAETSAAIAGLRYVSDVRPGIRRVRAGRGFSYRDTDGRRITDPATLKRIRSLAIPPAWKQVWICPLSNGHIQASGRDAKNYKQYRYHDSWMAIRSQNKFNRMPVLARVLPLIRRRTAEDLGKPGLPQEKVLAAVVRLLEESLIRVGNVEYARSNGSYGVTTIREDQVQVQGETVRFQFRGKSGKDHSVTLRSPRLARVIKRCQELAGEDLFRYADEAGQPRTITSGDVNDYLQAVTGEEITAKDFRTWGGTVRAVAALQEIGPFETEAEARRNVVTAVKMVSRQLGNTPATCRKYYIHPTIFEAYVEGRLPAVCAPGGQPDSPGLSPEEELVLTLIESSSELRSAA